MGQLRERRASAAWAASLEVLVARHPAWAAWAAFPEEQGVRRASAASLVEREERRASAASLVEREARRASAASVAFPEVLEERRASGASVAFPVVLEERRASEAWAAYRGVQAGLHRVAWAAWVAGQEA
tara:strand:+ start:890 stop:1276 length:387 start_codon:yes stop_codon:yes gene_type:complete